MTHSMHFPNIETFSDVLREKSDTMSLVVWLPVGVSNGYRDSKRILTVSGTSIPVGQLHAIPAAIVQVRERIRSGWLSGALERWRRSQPIERMFIPNGSTGAVVTPRRRDALLVIAPYHGEVDITISSHAQAVVFVAHVAKTTPSPVQSMNVHNLGAREC